MSGTKAVILGLPTIPKPVTKPPITIPPFILSMLNDSEPGLATAPLTVNVPAELATSFIETVSTTLIAIASDSL